LHQFAYLKLVGLTFSLLGLGNPKFWDSQQRFRARLLWLLPLLQDLANHIPEGLDNLIKSHHVAVYCLALHHKIWIWSFIRSYHMYVYIYHIMSCHIIWNPIISYYIISYIYNIFHVISLHDHILFYYIILYCNQNIDVHPPSIHRLNALHPLHFACLLQGLQVAFQNGLEHRTTCVSSCVPGESGVLNQNGIVMGYYMIHIDRIIYIYTVCI